MKAIRAWHGVRMRTIAASIESDAPERPVTLPASWDDAAAAALAELAPHGAPSLAEAAAAWIEPIAEEAQRHGFGPIGETLHALLRARQAAPTHGIWAGTPEAEPGFLLNLANFHDAASGFDIEAFGTAIDAAVIALSIAAPDAPRIRLAPTDLAGLLACLGLDYALRPGADLAACLAALLRARADAASARIAETLGGAHTPPAELPAPPASCLIPGLAAAAAAIANPPGALRHAATTGVLPPGPVDALLGAETGGIAPAFSPLAAAGHLTRTARAHLAASGLSAEAALARALAGLDPLPSASAEAGIAMRAAIAPYIQLLPRLAAPLPAASPAQRAAERRDLPQRARGYTQRATVGGHTVFLRTGEYADGALGEISITPQKESATFRALMECFSQAVSIGLQHGVKLDEYVDAFSLTRFGASGAVEGDPAVSRATSLLDYAFRNLAVNYLNRADTPPVAEEFEAPLAPLLPLDLPQEETKRAKLRLVKKMSIEARLSELGLAVPTPAAPLANYVPSVRTGNLLFVSGQLPIRNGVVAYKGKLGAEVTLDDGKAAAAQCFLNLLGQVKAATGSLDAVRRIVRLGGFIAAVPTFTDLAVVMNGASDLAGAVFGELGRHARSTVAVPVLPADAAVEIEGLFEV